MKDELQAYVEQKIPLAKALGASFEEPEELGLTVNAPLQPNINHLGSVFGGSAASVAVLSAWALLHHKLEQEGLKTSLVIQESNMSYLKPILGDFSATSRLEPSQWSRFLTMLSKFGKARITLRSTLHYDGQEAGHFEGYFVALSAPD
jgi:thioesterase domain-containing protein